MDAPTAPQRVIANAEYPYGDQVERARELLTRMGIADVKPLYAPRMPVANDTATPGHRSHLNRLIQTARLERLAG